MTANCWGWSSFWNWWQESKIWGVWWKGGRSSRAARRDQAVCWGSKRKLDWSGRSRRRPRLVRTPLLRRVAHRWAASEDDCLLIGLLDFVDLLLFFVCFNGYFAKFNIYTISASSHQQSNSIYKYSQIAAGLNPNPALFKPKMKKVYTPLGHFLIGLCDSLSPSWIPDLLFYTNPQTGKILPQSIKLQKVLGRSLLQAGLITTFLPLILKQLGFYYLGWAVMALSLIFTYGYLVFYNMEVTREAM